LAHHSGPTATLDDLSERSSDVYRPRRLVARHGRYRRCWRSKKSTCRREMCKWVASRTPRTADLVCGSRGMRWGTQVRVAASFSRKWSRASTLSPRSLVDPTCRAMVAGTTFEAPIHVRGGFRVPRRTSRLTWPTTAAPPQP